jgi:alanine dehydrogenase
MIKIGIIREDKVPVDKRVPLTPLQAAEIQKSFKVQIFVQKSTIRCYSDEDYEGAGLPVVDDLSHCDIILGVKEVPKENLIPNKTYLFFSHTIKKQAYNKNLLKTILNKNIRLIDWETIRDNNGLRLIAFGRWAGIVGAYNGLWAYGKRYNLFDLRRAHECFDYSDLKNEYKKIVLPPIKIALTGGGRVSKGAIEVLNGVGIRHVTVQDFINERFDEPVYCQLNTRDYNKKITGEEFHRNEFYAHPELFQSDFHRFSRVTDLLIAGAFWHPSAPVLFKREAILQDDFNIKVIADITCDIEGSIPSTKKASTIDDPIYDFNPSDDVIEPPLSDEGNITVMAVDNLPCELPRDASESFGDQFIQKVLPALLEKDNPIINNATITNNGDLTKNFKYLDDFVNS